MELRSRSRSKTPFLHQSETFTEAESFAKENHVMVTRSTRKSTTIKSTASNINRAKTKSLESYKTTSDYSSEDGDFMEVSSDYHLTQNEKNQIIEDAKKAANGSAEISALNLYRKAGRYWDKYPKTDYTYSPHSRDRVEIAPGVVQMPNMSRPTIHSGTNTEPWVQHSVRQRLFNNNQIEEYDQVDSSFKIYRRSTTITSRIISIFTSIFSVFITCISSISKIHRVFIWIGKMIHLFVGYVMLLDTWILQKRSNENKMRNILALCFIPLILFGGLHYLWSRGISLAPFCHPHPHCGHYIAAYYNSFINTAPNLYNSSINTAANLYNSSINYAAILYNRLNDYININNYTLHDI